MKLFCGCAPVPKYRLELSSLLSRKFQNTSRKIEEPDDLVYSEVNRQHLCVCRRAFTLSSNLVQGVQLWNDHLKICPSRGWTSKRMLHEIIFVSLACGRARLHFNASWQIQAANRDKVPGCFHRKPCSLLCEDAVPPQSLSLCRGACPSAEAGYAEAQVPTESAWPIHPTASTDMIRPTKPFLKRLGRWVLALPKRDAEAGERAGKPKPSWASRGFAWFAFAQFPVLATLTGLKISCVRRISVGTRCILRVVSPLFKANVTGVRISSAATQTHLT